MTTYNSVSNGSKHKQIYKCGWLWQTGYYAKTKQKGGRGMREGWIEKRFDEVFTLQMGKTPDRKNKAFFEGTNTWVSIKDLGDKYISSSHECISDEAATNISIVKKGTVIMSFKLTVGKCAIAAKDLYTNEAIMAFNTKDGYEINSSFLYYYLKGYKWNGANKAVMGLTLNKATISKHNLSIPPLSTQQSIVSELDKINELIRLKKEQLKDYDNLAQSIFYEMFGDPVVNEKGWELKKLGDVCKFTQGTQVPIEEQHLSKENGLVQFLRIIDFTQGKDAPRFVKCSNDKYILHEREIAIVRYGTPGFVCYGKIGAIANNLFKITPNQKDMFEFEFLVHWLNTEAFQSAVKSKQYGAALQAIKFSTIQGINIIIPSLTVQRSFATRISQIDKQKQYIEESIKELESLLASRMQYWFD